MGAFLFLLILAFLKSHSAEGTGCLNGLTSSPASTCVDNKTCVDVACGENATCVNESGTFKCKCSVGFTYKTSKMDKCEDINECLSGGCPSGDCFNTLGSYYCQYV
ncbi:fibulin-1-like [Esox lucius]|uniref:fibulin-1-like n=1 Tax=Esox lucius TaxID=8010 RepID=UPI0014772769|nr:fibulin-1-like [Esox lucius]